jgi:KaiC/GvpD/RAD55 family RecA-like ATPase
MNHVDFKKPLPSVRETYQRLTGRDPLASTLRPARDTFAVPCVSAANHRHGDASPSLHIDVVKDVWICRVCAESGGKSADLVVHAGIARDRSEAANWLCPPEPPAAPPPPIEQRRVTARYDYCDDDGEVLYQVVRYEWDLPDGGIGKTFGQRRHLGNDRWEGKLGDVKRVPYRLPEILSTTLDGKTLYVVEGEKDVESLWMLGLPATTSAGGAGWAWTDEFVEYFRGFPSVVVIGDHDEAGRAAAKRRAEVLADRCGTVRLVETMPQVPHKGDVSDWISDYRKRTPGATTERIANALRATLHKAAIVKTAEADDGSMREWDKPVLHNYLINTQKPQRDGLKIGVRAIDEKTRGFLQPGQTTVVGARTNVGKTLFLEHIIVENWERHKILAFALEMGVVEMHDRLVARAQGMKVRDYRLDMRPDIITQEDADWFNRKLLRMVGKTREATPERIIEAIERFQPDLVIIDHARHISGWSSARGKDRIDLAPAEVMDKLMSAGRKLGHHTIVASQITRDATDKRPELHHLRDSGSVEEMADQVVMLHRPFKGGDPADDDVMEVIVKKARETPAMIAHMRFIGDIMALENPRPEDYSHLERCCA